MSDRGMLLLQGGRVVAADGEYDADVLIEGEKIAAVGAVDAPGATRRRRLGLPGDAGADRQPHAPVDAVHGDDVLRRLRHRHAGGGGRRRDLPRRLLDPARAGQPALRAGRVAGPRRGRRARRLRLPHGDHQRQRVRARRDGADDRGGRLHLQAVHGLQGRADGARRRARGGDGARPRPRRADHGPRRERRRRRPAGQARARARGHVGDPPRAHAAGVRRGRGDRPRRAGWPSTRAPRCSSCT